MTDIEQGFATACTLHFDTPDEVLEELMENAATESPPSAFGSRDLYYEPEDFEGYELLYSNGPAKTPEFPSTHTAVFSNIMDEEIFHVHSYWTPEDFDVALLFHEKLLSPLDEVTARITASFTTDSDLVNVVNSFEGINISSEDLEIGTMEAKYESWQVQFMDTPDSNMISMTRTDGKEIAPETLQETIENEFEIAKQTLEGIVI